MSKFIKKVILVLFLFLILFIGILEYFLEEITIDGSFRSYFYYKFGK